MVHMMNYFFGPKKELKCNSYLNANSSGVDLLISYLFQDGVSPLGDIFVAIRAESTRDSTEGVDPIQNPPSVPIQISHSWTTRIPPTDFASYWFGTDGRRS